MQSSGVTNLRDHVVRNWPACALGNLHLGTVLNHSTAFDKAQLVRIERTKAFTHASKLALPVVNNIRKFYKHSSISLKITGLIPLIIYFPNEILVTNRQVTWKMKTKTQTHMSLGAWSIKNRKIWNIAKQKRRKFQPPVRFHSKFW